MSMVPFTSLVDPSTRLSGVPIENLEDGLDSLVVGTLVCEVQQLKLRSHDRRRSVFGC